MASLILYLVVTSKRTFLLKLHLHALQSYTFNYILDTSTSSSTAKINTDSTFSSMPKTPLSPLLINGITIYWIFQPGNIGINCEYSSFHLLHPTVQQDLPISSGYFFCIWSLLFNLLAWELQTFSLGYYSRCLISTNPLSSHAVYSSSTLAIRSAFPNLFHVENHETPLFLLLLVSSGL